jgi:hypothetical protein
MELNEGRLSVLQFTAVQITDVQISALKKCDHVGRAAGKKRKIDTFIMLVKHFST